LIDDERDNLCTFDLYLKSVGYSSTISLNDPVEALEYFNKNSSNCILIITDYKIPQMSGLDLIEKIREKDLDYKIKTILISGTVKDNIINRNNRFLKLKINKFLEKPIIPLEKLKMEIDTLIK
jgi:CheY-like chemotaxis protein